MKSAHINVRKAVEAAMQTFITDITPGAFMDLVATLKTARDQQAAPLMASERLPLMAGALAAEAAFYPAIVQYANSIVIREQNLDPSLKTLAPSSWSAAAAYPFL